MEHNDFFLLTSDKLETLNVTEKKLFDFVVKNMDEVKQMSIRQFAQACYISTATIFRFINKLGFSGYKEFIAVLKITDMSRTKAVIPNVMKYKGYREDYLKNLIESVRVIRKEQVRAVHEKLKTDPQIYLFGAGLTREAARYVEHLFRAFGCRAMFAYEDYEAQNAVHHMTGEDMVIIMSYTGKTKRLIEILEQIKRKCSPMLISITRSDNNMVQLMTDYNFYFFADEIIYNGYDLTSRVAMISVVEIILYELFCEMDETPLPEM